MRIVKEAVAFTIEKNVKQQLSFLFFLFFRFEGRAVTPRWETAHKSRRDGVSATTVLIFFLRESRFHSSSFHPEYLSRTLRDHRSTPHSNLLQIHIPSEQTAILYKSLCLHPAKPRAWPPCKEIPPSQRQE